MCKLINFCRIEFMAWIAPFSCFLSAYIQLSSTAWMRRGKQRERGRERYIDRTIIIQLIVSVLGLTLSVLKQCPKRFFHPLSPTLLYNIFWLLFSFCHLVFPLSEVIKLDAAWRYPLLNDAIILLLLV